MNASLILCVYMCVDYLADEAIAEKWTIKLLEYLIDGVNTIGEGHWDEIRKSYDFPSCMSHEHLCSQWHTLRVKGVVTFKQWKWTLTQ